jgi:hypothetical protein
MGWARTLFLGDWGNRLDIEDCVQDIKCLRIALRQQQLDERSTGRKLTVQDRELGEIKLYLAAIVRLLTAKGVVTRADFARIVEAIDVSDGTADGQFSGELDGG